MKVISALCTLIFASLCYAKVTVKKFEMCEADKDYKIKFTSKLRTENDMQIVEEGGMTSTVDMGDNVKILTDVYSLENGKYEFLIAIKETVCNALQKYLGEFGYELQKASGVEPGKCPIPKGDYSIKDHPLDFQKFKYRNVPKGQLKIKTNFLDNETNATLGCIESEILLE